MRWASACTMSSRSAAARGLASRTRRTTAARSTVSGMPAESAANADETNSGTQRHAAIALHARIVILFSPHPRQRSRRYKAIDRRQYKQRHYQRGQDAAHHDQRERALSLASDT